MKVVLGVTASVAIYKAAELVRVLRAEGADVTVVTTPHANHLVGPRLWEAVTERRAVTDLFADEHAFAHLEVASGAEAVAVVPATANTIGKLAAGIADEPVTTVALAVDCGRLVAPAMNPKMWERPEVQRNVATLRELGYVILGPEEGSTACGDVGRGRLAEVGVIAEEIFRLASTSPRYVGKTVVVTAGPTAEPFDAVRALTNRSSGLMGYEVARRAARRGAKVRLVTGTTSDPIPLGTNVHIDRVKTAEDMLTATREAFEGAEALIMTAAVSDYRFDEVVKGKSKKSKGKPSTALIPTVDIVSEIAEYKGDRIVIGFAAETDNLVDNAKDKLLKKKLDMIVANVVGVEGVGFGELWAEAALVKADGVDDLGRITKAALADRVLDELEALAGWR
ncbi:MAG: bifunctional phosphopantothenoylcysteine decarboxylase/phosphopantothenate--cysteine ligase CoaBC [Candidatus Coatesbacteria bacterium]|nr:MAG: bifunctional phosphopantothenoylcysteine decarboxylase/phosphopantothenate--cysteine ligase CoaBC [Candidatus Coatesbacteria bacterium]